MIYKICHFPIISSLLVENPYATFAVLVRSLFRLETVNHYFCLFDLQMGAVLSLAREGVVAMNWSIKTNKHKKYSSN